MDRADERVSRAIHRKTHTITPDFVALIEVELDPYDVVSLVFLLYDTPDTALQKLLVYQRLSRDDSNMNLLSSWARAQQVKNINWRIEFVEALAVCQLYKIIRKLGFNMNEVKDFCSLEQQVYLNPMKKALYRLCEYTTLEELEKLKRSAKTYGCDTSQCETCEVLILKLISDKFITVPHNTDRALSNRDEKYDIDRIINIIQNISELCHFTSILKDIQSKLNGVPVVGTCTPKVAKNKAENEEKNDEDITKTFDEVYKLLSELTLEENKQEKHLKCDKKNEKYEKLEAYKIKDPTRLGVCYIINQIDFYPSKDSIETVTKTPNKRQGSGRDQSILEKTFESLKFEVIAHSNLDHMQMKEMIANIVDYRVQPKDSMFVLCILSHGIKGHVYAADTVPVKVEDIQKWLDSSFEMRKLEIPKIMLIQACQVNSEPTSPTSNLVADSLPNQFMRKAHFLVYWATAPELEAYRDEKRGSVFIQLLCLTLYKYAGIEDAYSIFTKVNKYVARCCSLAKKEQMPIFESTLMEKLYLQEPQ